MFFSQLFTFILDITNLVYMWTLYVLTVLVQKITKFKNQALFDGL